MKIFSGSSNPLLVDKKNKLNVYTLGLNLSGNIYFVINVSAKNLNDAVVKWAILTSHNDPLFNLNNRTYFGWPIVETDLFPL